MHDASDQPRDDGPPTRWRPTVLALLAFVPLAAILWWVLAGPRPEPARLDWSVLGLEVTEEHGRAPAWQTVHDPEWVRMEMAGWQADLGGRLDQPLPVGPERYAAVVRDGDAAAFAPLSELVGAVEWTAGGGAEPRRCAFDRPVPLDGLREELEADESDLRLEEGALVGRCADDGPVVAVPLVRRHTVPQGALRRLIGQHAESALVPAGLVLATAEGTVERRRELPADLRLAAYPREVARAALLEAAPANPAAEIGSWADPVYPLAVGIDDRVWWVMPLAPRDGAATVSGYALTAADEFEGGALNPVRIVWLPEPVAGPAAVIRRTERLLAEVDDPAAADLAVRPTLPDDEGGWRGRVGAPDDSLRFLVELDGDGGLCLRERDGYEVRCEADQATTARSSRQ